MKTKKIEVYLKNKKEFENIMFEKVGITQVDNNLVKSNKLMRRAEFLLDKHILDCSEQKELAWIMERVEKLVMEEELKLTIKHKGKNVLNKNYSA